MAGLFDTRYTHGYDTPQDAAAGAEYLLRQQPNYHGQEYASVITRGPDGKFYHSGFDRSADSATASHAAPISRLLDEIPTDHTPIGVLHNHPDRPESDHIDTSWLSQADVNIGKGFGSYQNQWQSIDPRNPVMSRDKPTGPLTQFLANGEVGLGQANGRLQKLTGDGTHQYNVGLTAQVLAEIPIDEMKRNWANKIMQNQLMPADLKQRLLSSVVTPFSGPTQ
jgi:hypothetical protein